MSKLEYMSKKQIADRLLQEAEMYVQACEDVTKLNETHNHKITKANATFFIELAKAYMRVQKKPKKRRRRK